MAQAWRGVDSGGPALDPYAGLWLDFLLCDFQDDILAVVTGRAEAL
jgi:hypothetical protein